MLYLLNDWVLKLLGTPPLPDAGQAVCVIAVGKNPKSPLRSRRLLEDHFHADTTHFVLTCLEGKGLFHLMFECRHADLKGGGKPSQVLGCWEQLPAIPPQPRWRRNVDCGCFRQGPAILGFWTQSFLRYKKDFKPSVAQPLAFLAWYGQPPI